MGKAFAKKPGAKKLWLPDRLEERAKKLLNNYKMKVFQSYRFKNVDVTSEEEIYSRQFLKQLKSFLSVHLAYN